MPGQVVEWGYDPPDSKYYTRCIIYMSRFKIFGFNFGTMRELRRGPFSTYVEASNSIQHFKNTFPIPDSYEGVKIEFDVVYERV